MSSVMGPIVLGILILIIGVFNIKGNISSLHWYHRHRVADKDKTAFGKIIGIGTITIGVAMILLGGLSYITEIFENEFLTLIGSVIVIVAIAVGIIINFYAMIKYNKGIF